jgi:hypothetical protein
MVSSSLNNASKSFSGRAMIWLSLGEACQMIASCIAGAWLSCPYDRNGNARRSNIALDRAVEKHFILKLSFMTHPCRYQINGPPIDPERNLSDCYNGAGSIFNWQNRQLVRKHDLPL